MKVLPALALIAVLTPLPATAANNLSGQYGPLLLAVQGDVVSGAFSERRVGNGSDNAPQFSCAFLLTGNLKNSQASIVTWYPGQPSIAGQLTLSSDGVSLKLKDGQPGCGMTSGDMVDHAWESSRDTPGSGWTGARLIASAKAVLRKTAAPTVALKPYLVRDDAVAVLTIQGAWVEVSYPGADKPVQGWVAASELTPANPPHR